MEQLAERLRELRESRGLTQARLAELLGVSLDELAGRAESTDDVQIRNPKLRELYHQLDGSPTRISRPSSSSSTPS